MIIAFLRYLLGYVKFSIKGEFPERLLNQLAANNIAQWGLDRKDGTLTACIKAKDYLKIREIRGKNKVKTQIICRYGLPFFLKKYRLRVGFAVGLAFYIASLFFMSSFVWNIDVVGNNTVSDKQILSVCEELGLYEGSKISHIDTNLLKTQLALKLDEVSWASVNIEGVKATVNISESIGNKNEKQQPCNLIACRDGVITGLKVTEGTIAVKMGQTVTAGDLLVSGIIDYKDGTSSFTISSGEVFAETERTLSFLANYVQTEKIYVAPPQRRSVLTVFGLNIPLYLGTLKGNFETETTLKRFKKNGMYLPITLTETSFLAVDQRAYEITTEQAEALAKQKLFELEAQELENVEILSKTENVEVTEKGVLITATYKCKENIAVSDLLLIYEEK